MTKIVVFAKKKPACTNFQKSTDEIWSFLIIKKPKQ